MEVRLDLSPKQHTSLRKGRKVRISHKHMNGSGVPYILHPPTFHRLKHAYDNLKGVDVALSPDEIRASITGGKINIKQGIKDSKKIGRFIGGVFKPLNSQDLKDVKHAMAQGAISEIQLTTNPNQVYLDQAAQAEDLLNPYVQPYLPEDKPQVASGQNVDYIAKAAVASAIANSYNPYRAPIEPTPSYVGTYTAPTSTLLPGQHTLASEMLGQGFRHHLIGRGAISHKFFDRTHAALKSDPYSVSFLQQLPGVFKDAHRIASGGTLWL